MPDEHRARRRQQRQAVAERERRLEVAPTEAPIEVVKKFDQAAHDVGRHEQQDRRAVAGGRDNDDAGPRSRSRQWTHPPGRAASGTARRARGRERPRPRGRRAAGCRSRSPPPASIRASRPSEKTPNAVREQSAGGEERDQKQRSLAGAVRQRTIGHQGGLFSPPVRHRGRALRFRGAKRAFTSRKRASSFLRVARDAGRGLAARSRGARGFHARIAKKRRALRETPDLCTCRAFAAIAVARILGDASLNPCRQRPRRSSASSDARSDADAGTAASVGRVGGRRDLRARRAVRAARPRRPPAVAVDQQRGTGALVAGGAWLRRGGLCAATRDGCARRWSRRGRRCLRR